MNETRFGAVLWGGRGHVFSALSSQQKTRPRENPKSGHMRPRPFSDLFYVAASRPAQMTTGYILITLNAVGVNRAIGTLYVPPMESSAMPAEHRLSSDDAFPQATGPLADFGTRFGILPRQRL